MTSAPDPLDALNLPSDVTTCLRGIKADVEAAYLTRVEELEAEVARQGTTINELILRTHERQRTIIECANVCDERGRTLAMAAMVNERLGNLETAERIRLEAIEAFACRDSILGLSREKGTP